MELPLRGTRHLMSSPPDGLPPNVHHHRHHHHPAHKFTSAKDNLSKSEGQLKAGFAHKKQCRYPEDPESIDNIVRDESNIIKLKPGSKSMGRKQGLLWTQHRDQANMNQYEINTSGKSKSVSNVFHDKHPAWKTADPTNPEYSYAYCEPIIKKIGKVPHVSTTTHRTTTPKITLPTSHSDIELCKTHKPPRNSLRALLTKSFRKSSVSHPDERHTFTTNYGKKENIYEDVDRVLGTKPKHSFSSESVNKLPLDEELKFVEFQHNRVMNELSLSIEEMLMPSQSEADHLDAQMFENSQLDEYKNSPTGAGGAIGEDKRMSFEMLRRPEQPLFAMTQIQMNPSFDIDSGISGSSSSAASYAGSVRYHRTNFPTTSRNTTIYETPGTVQDQNLSPYHLIRGTDDSTKNPELPYPEQCSPFCCYAPADEPQISTNNAMQSERRIETISEKVILWNKMARIKDTTSNSTKCNGKQNLSLGSAYQQHD